jgi:hypothetical protein
MPSYLPEVLSQYIDPTSTYATLRNLIAAAESGSVDLSAVTAYARAAAKGDAIRFSRTVPIPLIMKETIERRSHLEPRRVVYQGLEEGLWDWSDVEAWETNEAILREVRLKSPPKKGVYLTRGRRSAPRLPRTEGMFVPKMSLDAICSFKISDGAKACLAVLMSIAGRETTFTTYTSSIAHRMGRTARTVRNHFIALEEAGLIVRTQGSSPNTVRITITETCRPEPYKEPDDIKAYKLARRSSNPALQILAFTAASAAMQAFPTEFEMEDRRKEISAFNPESIFFLFEARSSVDKARRHRGATTHSDLIRPERSGGPDRVPFQAAKWGNMPLSPAAKEVTLSPAMVGHTALDRH